MSSGEHFQPDDFDFTLSSIDSTEYEDVMETLLRARGYELPKQLLAPPATSLVSELWRELSSYSGKDVAARVIVVSFSIWLLLTVLVPILAWVAQVALVVGLISIALAVVYRLILGAIALWERMDG